MESKKNKPKTSVKKKSAARAPSLVKTKRKSRTSTLKKKVTKKASAPVVSDVKRTITYTRNEACGICSDGLSPKQVRIRMLATTLLLFLGGLVVGYGLTMLQSQYLTQELLYERITQNSADVDYRIMNVKGTTIPGSMVLRDTIVVNDSFEAMFVDSNTGDVYVVPSFDGAVITSGERYLVMDDVVGYRMSMYAFGGIAVTPFNDQSFVWEKGELIGVIDGDRFDSAYVDSVTQGSFSEVITPSEYVVFDASLFRGNEGDTAFIVRGPFNGLIIDPSSDTFTAVKNTSALTIDQSAETLFLSGSGALVHQDTSGIYWTENLSSAYRMERVDSGDILTFKDISSIVRQRSTVASPHEAETVIQSTPSNILKE